MSVDRVLWWLNQNISTKETFSRITIGGALVAMSKTNKYLTLIKLNDISDIILFSHQNIQKIFYCRVIQLQIFMVVVVLNSRIIKWPMYIYLSHSTLAWSTWHYIFDAMIKLSFCWSITSTTLTIIFRRGTLHAMDYEYGSFFNQCG